MEFTEVCILKIHIGEDVFMGDDPLYKRIIEEARKLHLAGGTVYKCLEGFASETRGLGKRLLVNFTDPNNLPVVIEIVDSRENINKILPFLEKHLSRGMASVTNTKVLMTDYLRERIKKIEEIDKNAAEVKIIKE